MKKSSTAAPIIEKLPPRRPTRAQAEEAVRTLLAWAGDDPARAGLLQTPQRVVDAYGEYFSGYGSDALTELSATFEDVTGYDDIVMLKDIPFESHCEHHVAPFRGIAHVAYLPNRRIVGLSKLARVVEIYARRLQTQEALTSEIAQALMDGLGARGVGVMMLAEHDCMSMRGVRQRGTKTITSRFMGCLEADEAWRNRFFAMLQTSGNET
ncbi:MAG: GTP cyclohydrolase I FolE [Hyphomicrobium sp.]